MLSASAISGHVIRSARIAAISSNSVLIHMAAPVFSVRRRSCRNTLLRIAANRSAAFWRSSSVMFAIMPNAIEKQFSDRTSAPPMQEARCLTGSIFVGRHAGNDAGNMQAMCWYYASYVLETMLGICWQRAGPAGNMYAMCWHYAGYALVSSTTTIVGRSALICVRCG